MGEKYGTRIRKLNVVIALTKGNKFFFPECVFSAHLTRIKLYNCLSFVYRIRYRYNRIIVEMNILNGLEFRDIVRIFK